MIEKIKNNGLIKKIIKYSKGYRVYLVGGCIRDYILDRENYDKDLIVDCDDVRAYSKNLAEMLNATFVPLDEENKIYRLVLEDKLNSIDIAGIIGNTLEEDFKRRDFTINSIAVNLSNMEIIDVNNGIKDIQKRVISSVSDKNLADDPLRLLRAYRFHSSLGFSVEPHLKTFIDKNFKTLDNIAIERINTELYKLFDGKYAHETLKIMDDMLEYLFPIMKDVKTVPENSHHHLPLFLHCIETVKQVQELYEKSDDIIKALLKPKLSLLKLAAFLHDIGKPQTWTIEEETGRHRFIKHDDVGSKLVVPILKKLNFSKKQINYVSSLIKYHIYPSQVVLHDDEKSYMRFIRKMGELSVPIIYIAMADRLSAKGPMITDEIVNNNIEGLKKLLKFYIDIKDALKPLPKLLDGNEIMELYNIKPSKELGMLINSLKEAQLSGDVSTREQACTFVESFLAYNKM